MAIYQTGTTTLPTLAGTERVSVDNGAGGNTVANVQALVMSGAAPIVTSNTATSSATLAAANIYGSYDSVYLNLSGTLGGAANATLPTVAALAALFPNGVTAGQGYMLTIINSSSANYAWTVLTATGWTLTGTMTVAQNTTRTFIINFTSASAATLTSVGTGTYS
jgi:hypothetical protein